VKREDFVRMTANLGVYADCPICGYSWPGCRGMCVAHRAMNEAPGPYHDDFNDDCLDCEEERKEP